MLDRNDVQILFFTNPHYGKMLYSFAAFDIHELDGITEHHRIPVNFS